MALPLSNRLRAATGLPVLHHATQTLTVAAGHVLDRIQPDGRHWRRFFAARLHPDHPRGRVHDYHLSEQLVPIFDQALRNLGR